MLVLSRHRDEEIVVVLPDGQKLIIMPVDIRGDKVRLGIDAPKSIAIHRREIWDQICAEKELTAAPAA